MRQRDRTGSSPLARGAQHRDRLLDRLAWIIPARAGSTTGTSGAAVPYRDHPRSRGGALPFMWESASRGRIIPARAGSTSAKAKLAGLGQDHPRSRGEHEPKPRRVWSDVGSSPLARGARFLTRGNGSYGTDFIHFDPRLIRLYRAALGIGRCGIRSLRLADGRRTRVTPSKSSGVQLCR